MEKVHGEERYRISEDTINRIAKVCTKPFDYILTDFAFIGDGSKNEALRNELVDEARDLKSEDFSRGTILQAHDVKIRFEELAVTRPLDSSTRRQFEANFLKHSGPITIYTNSPPPFAGHFNHTVLHLRKYEIQQVFPNAGPIAFLLMHEEFSTSSVALTSLTAERMKSYYSLWLSKRIADEIKIITLEKMVRLQHKLRVTDTRKAFRSLTASGIGLGASVALMGEVIFHLLRETLAICLQDLRFTFHPPHIPTVDSRLITSLFALLGALVLSLLLFPEWGVRITKKLEGDADRLLDGGAPE
jgi:hypothetical protein